MMTTWGPEPEVPGFGFFLRAEAVAAAAFRTIPFVGHDVADFFLRAVVPFCTPGRDRVVWAIFRRLMAIEGGIHLIIMRAIPLP
jgi:hypothetical protein